MCCNLAFPQILDPEDLLPCHKNPTQDTIDPNTFQLNNGIDVAKELNIQTSCETTLNQKIAIENLFIRF
jgi:hypothetical protein